MGSKRVPDYGQEERDKVLAKLAWYSPHWRSQMHLKQSRMYSSMWSMMKGPRPEDQQVFAEPVPPDKFAETHNWITGS
eukprot:4718620-Prorocentrum_lima.AAC.1